MCVVFMLPVKKSQKDISAYVLRSAGDNGLVTAAVLKDVGMFAQRVGDMLKDSAPSPSSLSAQNPHRER